MVNSSVLFDHSSNDPSAASDSQKTATPECVGPGSYSVPSPSHPVLHVPKPESSVCRMLRFSSLHSTADPTLTLSLNFPANTIQEVKSERLREWGDGPADARQMDSAGEWKFTSEKPSPTHYSFRRAAGPTWIEQVEAQQRRFSPHARSRQPTLKSTAEQRLPNFLQGVRNPVQEGGAKETRDRGGGKQQPLQISPPCCRNCSRCS